MKTSRLRRAIVSRVDKVSREYGLIEPGDRILVALSGGADSFVLLDVLRDVKHLAGGQLDILAVHLDLGYKPEPNPDVEGLRAFLEREEIAHRIERTDIGPLAHSEVNRANPCFLCARLRRKRLFEIAQEEGCRKLAYGHHKDDVIATFFLNLLYSRELSTMVPKQDFFGGLFYLIRPLYYVDESLIKKYAAKRDYPIFDSGCPIAGNTERDKLSEIVRSFTRGRPQLRENIFKALHRVKLDYLPKQQPGGFR
ncbi:MAG: tRNA 2-thiocytidine(32) synthetase TtcA [Calditrichaeota bacterium]|nr:tRNA 2-thiocytidine(32) synthetase TtcA [Calditrichota bacterium]